MIGMINAEATSRHLVAVDLLCDLTFQTYKVRGMW